MARTLTWINGARWTQDVPLDGRVFTLRVDWNGRMETWTFDLETGDGERLLSGERIVKDYPMLPRWRDERFPPGQLFAVAPSGGIRQDPGRNGFDERFRLVYLEGDDAEI